MAMLLLPPKAAGGALYHRNGVRCVCLRFFTVYGARQRPDLAIPGNFQGLSPRGKPSYLFCDGSMRQGLHTYIDDIIQGVRSGDRL